MVKETNEDSSKDMIADAPSPEKGSIMDQDSSMFSQDQDSQDNAQRTPTNTRIPLTGTPLKLDYSQLNIDEIEEIIESIVDEKWRSLIENVGDMGLFKDKVRTEVISIKQEIIRLQNRFENLQKAILGKIQHYDNHMVEVGSEIKAMEKAFSKIIEPLTDNIKDLERITNKLKK